MDNEINPLNIALLTALDAQDRRSWSGTYYYLTQALQKYCGNVSFIGPLSASNEMFLGRLAHKSAQLFLHKNFAFRHTHAVSKHYAKVADTRLAGRSFDVIFALSGATEIAFLQTKVPIVLVEDANFAVLHGYHQHFSNLLESSAYQINDIQKRGINRANLILYPTEWAARAAIEYYHADKQKTYVIPFGANLEQVPTREQIFARQRSNHCRLLFIGVNWERKGGSIALETLVALEQLGITAELTICGCVPPKGVTHPHMKVVPFLDKNDEEQRKKLEALYMQSDFFLLPTRNECFGIALCEANAFGLPVITTQTGGVPEVIRNGANGFTLPYNAGGAAYAEVIARAYQNTSLYKYLVQSSRTAYEERLNWDAWGMSTKKVLQKMLDQQTPKKALVSQISKSSLHL
jgi:glycosyltransferase involved in cell wall biosynthesis